MLKRMLEAFTKAIFEPVYIYDNDGKAVAEYRGGLFRLL